MYSMVAISMQQMQVLVSAIQGDLKAQMETSHQEVQRRQEKVQGEMEKISKDIELLIAHLNFAELVNKDILSEVE